MPPGQETTRMSEPQRAPCIELSVAADALDTGNGKRDAHLRSSDFFDAETHPQVRFVSDSAALEGERLHVRGQLHAPGKSIPLELDATLRPVGSELEVEAITEADHRALGMTWNKLDMLRTPSTLIVSARLVRDGT
jgi:polyisoprenoid-binding protein YceI